MEELEFYDCLNLQNFPFEQYSESLKVLIIKSCKIYQDP